jgi:putative ABC transport system ATP-binding protein
MINLSNVIKNYQLGKNTIPVLKGINVHIAAGELVALMGPSGSGKSTTMNIMGLLDRPTAGQYHLDGQEVSTLTSDQQAELRNQTVGFVFQSFFLLPRLTALQNVALPLTYRNLSIENIHQQALACLEKIHVAHLAQHKPNEMSGGQQQRIAIARALVSKPKIILADEPTGALDSKTGQDVINLLIDINRQENATIVIVTHDNEIAQQCNRTIQIHDGNIV